VDCKGECRNTNKSIRMPGTNHYPLYRPTIVAPNKFMLVRTRNNCSGKMRRLGLSYFFIQYAISIISGGRRFNFLGEEKGESSPGS